MARRSLNATHDGGGNAPTLILGPPGSKKTVGLVATQLLDEPGKRSFIVVDPKLEIAAITANYRRKVCGGNNVKIVNPYGPWLRSGRTSKAAKMEIR